MTALRQPGWRLKLLISSLLIGTASVPPGAVSGPLPEASELTQRLRARQHELGLRPLQGLPPPPPEWVRLGQSLFFDPILSGNKDVACATCHHPVLASTDGLRLSIGSGGSGLGAGRRLGSGRQFTARHSPDLFERARQEWRVFFWDGRLQKNKDERWQARSVQGVEIPLPAGGQFPADLPGAAIQSWLPPLARVEMRGQVHHTPAGLLNDRAWDGSENELASLADQDLMGLWRGLQRRVLAIPAYASAYRLAAEKQLSLSGVEKEASETSAFMRVTGQALSAFMQVAFAADDTAWDQFLSGADEALTPAQKRGALLFYGRAGCGHCHSGSLFSDQQFHNIGVMPYAAALLPGSQQDLGRFLLTRRLADRYAFRTPPLRNVALTGPYFHNGSVQNLREAIDWHRRPVKHLREFRWTAVPWPLRSITHPERVRTDRIVQTLDKKLAGSTALSEREIADLVAFMHALTDERAKELEKWLPASVPSGLPVPRP